MPAAEVTAESLPADELMPLVAARSAAQLTVLMPLYRQERFVAEAVESVLAQQGVTCHIVISDDNSQDRTLQFAIDAVVRAKGEHPHAVSVRRGTTRLRRWHLQRLIEQTGADIVVQAHGDDRSLPGRMLALFEAFHDHHAAVVVSRFRTIDASGSLIADRSDDTGSLDHSTRLGVRPVLFDEALSRPAWGIGSVEAWRTESLRTFQALNPQFAPMSHDRLLLIRGALLGRAILVERALIDRRRHDDNWSSHLIDSSTASRTRHGWALVRVLLFATVMQDIDDAERGRAIRARSARIARAATQSLLTTALTALRSAHGDLLTVGERLIWLAEDSEDEAAPQ